MFAFSNVADIPGSAMEDLGLRPGGDKFVKGLVLLFGVFLNELDKTILD